MTSGLASCPAHLLPNTRLSVLGQDYPVLAQARVVKGTGYALPSQATGSLALLLLPSPMNTHLEVLASPG